MSAPAAITTPPSSSTSPSSSSAAAAPHPRSSTPRSNGTSTDDGDALALGLDLDHPEPDVDASDVEWGEASASAPGQRSIRLKPLSGGARRDNNTDSRYGDEEYEDEDEDGEEKRFLPGGDAAAPREALREDYELFTPDEERGVLRRLDRRLVLFMGLLYMLSFLDRSNIGNAKIAGLSRDLSLSSSQYEWLLTAFYVTYIAFEWMTLMYRLVPPHIYISICVFSWGLLASLQSLSTSFTSLLVLRALLGISEAAFGPGVPFYLSFFFRRDELAFRTGLFISAAPLSTSFASSLAWLITKLGQGGPWAPWRLLFLIEGFPSLFVAVWAWTFVPDGPGEAQWLSPRQREVAVLRLRKERDEDAGEKDAESVGVGRREAARNRGVNFREVLQTLVDPKCYLTALMFFSCNVAFSSVPVFLPTIIQEMGHSALTAQALSAPPYLLSFLAVLATAALSDRHLTRSTPLILHATLSTFSFAVLALLGRRPSATTTTVRYLALYPATASFFSAITLILAWSLNNQPTASRRGAGIALLNVVGQCGPLVGTRLFPAEEAPGYARGMGVCAGCMGVVGVLAGVLRWVLVRENGRSVRRMREEGGGEDGVPLVGGMEARGKGEAFLYML